MRTVIVASGAAGREAARCLPEARLIAQPEATAWHAEPGRIWIEDAAGVRAVPFDRLLLCDDEPLLLTALGCEFHDGVPAVDGHGRTSVPSVFAAGRVLGAATEDDILAQVRVAAQALAGGASVGAIATVPRRLPDAERLDPVGMAAVLEEPPGGARTLAALAQCVLLGPVLPSRPVGFAALAAMAHDVPQPGPVQADAGALE